MPIDCDRRTFLKQGAAFMGLALAPCTFAADAARPAHEKTLIGHRGACAYAPENTLESYQLAIKQGVDYVEQDLQITKDGVLVCAHDMSLERTTDVASVFPDRFVENVVKGKTVKQWPLHTFTVAEIKRLDAGSFMGEKFKGVTIPTWQEAIDLIRGKSGLCPETKAPEVYGKLGFDMEALVMRTLKKNGLDKPRGNDATPVFLQSFSGPSLEKLHKQYQLAWPALKLESTGVKLKPDAFAEIKQYATATGPFKRDITPELVTAAHAAGLKVITWTFRKGDEKEFDSVGEEMRHYLYDLGVDGMFTDNPDLFPRMNERAKG